MSRRPRYTLGGKPTSLREIGRLAGMSDTAVMHRIRAGELPEEIVATGSRQPRYMLRGRLVSAAEIGRIVGLTSQGVVRRLRAGETPEQIVRSGRRRRRGRRLTVDEIAEVRRLYASGAWTQAQLAERYGVSQGQIWGHLSEG